MIAPSSPATNADAVSSSTRSTSPSSASVPQQCTPDPTQGALRAQMFATRIPSGCQWQLSGWSRASSPLPTLWCPVKPEVTNQAAVAQCCPGTAQIVSWNYAASSSLYESRDGGLYCRTRRATETDGSVSRYFFSSLTGDGHNVLGRDGTCQSARQTVSADPTANVRVRSDIYDLPTDHQTGRPQLLPQPATFVPDKLALLGAHMGQSAPDLFHTTSAATTTPQADAPFDAFL